MGSTSCAIFKRKTTEAKTSTKQSKDSQQKAILKKYSDIIGERVENEKLYQFIDDWYGTPYKFGGKSRAGVDCSNFSCELLRQVYSFPPSYYFPSSKLAEQGKKINLSNAQEGDLVFFSINQNSKVSHVGIYLANKKFVHASTSKGVIINSLNEDYYKKRFAFVVRLVN